MLVQGDLHSADDCASLPLMVLLRALSPESSTNGAHELARTGCVDIKVARSMDLFGMCTCQRRTRQEELS
eukprot:CAMPEP_0194551456 /NCGR_PEP_ID=MMETSP0253-20130528/96227_1 /TAXON_ID=2966 /ORGANISM="Noctiluca scintillans" /LENGTH=69 /DNA_ID=CAMNT_0039398915 /DNA_START=743 /DNA_END=952 /DNA_ORIENTATION=-